jgi:RNA polymerase sigma factor (sigma-70 family)
VEAATDPTAFLRDRTFERLYRAHVRDVYRYTLAVLRNPADAEDVTQTTFLNAYRALQRGQEPQKPQHWLIKIAHNACRTRYLRLSRRPQEVPLEESLAELPVREEEIESVTEVLDALAQLPFNQRAALVMRELEGRSYVEIAETLETSVPAVESLLFRARRALRLRRGSLRVLTGIPVPPSLAVSGGTGVLAGGAAVGAGLLAKAAMVAATALIAGGIAYRAIAPAAAESGPTPTALREPERATVFAGAVPSVVAVHAPTRAAAPGAASDSARAGGGHTLGSGSWAKKHGVGGTAWAPVATGDATSSPAASTAGASGSTSGSASGATPLPELPPPPAPPELPSPPKPSVPDASAPTLTVPSLPTPPVSPPALPPPPPLPKLP